MNDYDDNGGCWFFAFATLGIALGLLAGTEYVFRLLTVAPGGLLDSVSTKADSVEIYAYDRLDVLTRDEWWGSALIPFIVSVGAVMSLLVLAALLWQHGLDRLSRHARNAIRHRIGIHPLPPPRRTWPYTESEIPGIEHEVGLFADFPETERRQWLNHDHRCEACCDARVIDGEEAASPEFRERVWAPSARLFDRA